MRLGKLYYLYSTSTLYILATEHLVLRKIFCCLQYSMIFLTICLTCHCRRAIMSKILYTERWIYALPLIRLGSIYKGPYHFLYQKILTTPLSKYVLILELYRAERELL